ncbi:MAG: hypothetical protein LH629_08010, partial [Ignavibacteria bacterium]|nr:hypothetical protein [Ignavibacteria bacterium]
SQNVKITDFNVPVSTAKKFIVNGTYNWSQTGDSVTSNQFNAFGDYSQFYSSLPFGWDLNLTAGTSRKFDDTVRVFYNLNTSVRKYFSNTKGFFGYAGLAST